MSSPVSPPNVLITPPPNPLALRQNSPQDCSNLVLASVDKATVEISRTIIALNATFSKQLQQASASASDGIKAAQDSASSMIDALNQSASVVQLQLSTASDAFASVSAASISDVARLSSSLRLMQANMDSVQGTASLAFAVAPTPAQGQSLSVIQTGRFTLTPGQVAAIAIGVALFSILLSAVTYILITRLRRRKRDSYLPDSNDDESTKEITPRQSSAFRTGNSMVMRFNFHKFHKSSDIPVPSLPLPSAPEYPSAISSYSKRLFFPSGTTPFSNDAEESLKPGKSRSTASSGTAY
ncbi:hypothetical protein GQ53DRAFT_820914 [Thozetella sp. PMI_491]|nr:hypothetical protein GQ53DRAFT_820914 [Thozetella sp. PMI_491]